MESEKATSTAAAAHNVFDQQPTHAPPPYHGAQYPHPPQQAVASGPAGVMMMNTGPAMGTKPTSYTCPNCHARIITKVETKVTSKTHSFAFLFCVVGCLPCIAIPYFVDSCKNMDHYCPECNAYIGSYVH